MNFAVIGANYGDEGKGLITDYLCAQHGADLVVRFNGGAQAGHTVVTPAGERHVFSHVGSGTFAGAATYLSRFFVVNPILFNKEWEKFPKHRKPKVFVDGECMVTTHFDMFINQAVEDARGSKRHGSCGVGFGETIERCERGFINGRSIGFTAGQLRSNTHECLEDIRDHWVHVRLRELGLSQKAFDKDSRSTFIRYLEEAEKFCKRVEIVRDSSIVRDAKCVVFEGAQGLLLDQKGKDFPHVTRSNTGLDNVLELMEERRQSDIEQLDVYYVTRTYLTRHGAGPLPDELGIIPYSGYPRGSWSDETNVKNDWQGHLRFAYLNPEVIYGAIWSDMAKAERFPNLNVSKYLAVTWVDKIIENCVTIQLQNRDVAEVPIEVFVQDLGFENYLRVSGPARNNVERALCDSSERSAIST